MKVTDKKPVLRNIDTIYPYPQNVKKHGDEQVKRVAESIKRFGWRGNPIIVDTFGVIIAGHGRRLAAISLGLKQVPVVVEEDMSAEEARAFRLADNRAAVGDIDGDLLKLELLDLDIDLLDGIFDKKELDFMSADVMTIDDSVFVSNLDTVMEEQQSVTNEKIDQSSAKRVSVAKALGFKDISGADTIYVSRFMAQLEAQTGLQGDSAFISFIKQLTGEISHG